MNTAIQSGLHATRPVWYERELWLDVLALVHALLFPLFALSLAQGWLVRTQAMGAFASAVVLNMLAVFVACHVGMSESSSERARNRAVRLMVGMVVLGAVMFATLDMVIRGGLLI